MKNVEEPLLAETDTNMDASGGDSRREQEAPLTPSTGDEPRDGESRAAYGAAPSTTGDSQQPSGEQPQSSSASPTTQSPLGEHYHHDPTDHLSEEQLIRRGMWKVALLLCSIMLLMCSGVLLITMYAAKFHAGCGFSFNAHSNFSHFKHTENICDLSSPISGTGTYLLGQLATYAMVGIIAAVWLVWFVHAGYAIFSVVSVVVVVPLFLTMVFSGFPFTKFILPAMIVTIFTCLCAICSWALFSYAKKPPPRDVESPADTQSPAIVDNNRGQGEF